MRRYDLGPEEPDICVLCGKDPYYCDCPVCKVCGEQGNPDCIESHGLVYHPKTLDCKRDDYGHALGDDGEGLTDPYGSLQYAVGTEDDFVCFDFAIYRGFVILHAVVNSETGHFIDRFDYEEIPILEYAGQASNLASAGMDWLYENGLRHSKMGWDQDYLYFAREVYLAVWVERNPGKVLPVFSYRQKRMGGKRINTFCHL